MTSFSSTGSHWPLVERHPGATRSRVQVSGAPGGRSSLKAHALYRPLLRQLELGLEGAYLLRDSLESGPTEAETQVAVHIRELADESTEHRNELLGKLVRAWTPPVNVEDLSQISQALARMVECLANIADVLPLTPRPANAVVRVVDASAEGLSVLGDVLARLADRSATLAAAQRLIQLHSECRLAIRGGLAIENVVGSDIRPDLHGLILRDECRALSNHLKATAEMIFYIALKNG